MQKKYITFGAVLIIILVLGFVLSHFGKINFKNQGANSGDSGAARDGQSLLTPGFPQYFNAVLAHNPNSTVFADPTAFAFSPDGRLFVTEQTGAVRIIQNGAILPTPFITLTVDSNGERGLNGIAFDPNFTTNQYIYLYYSVSGANHNRISRFTANGNVSLQSQSGETVVLDLDPLTASGHNGGALAFGPTDGKLYVGVGDGGVGANSQNKNNNIGKVLRINTDGTPAVGNPYYSTGTNTQQKQIWAYGMRNPFTISAQPGTGKIFANDVGDNLWEEIDDVTNFNTDPNFGWAIVEGSSANPLYINPLYSYNHGTAANDSGCAITGGTFFNPATGTSNYPASYIGKYFYYDFCHSWMNYLDISGATPIKTNFASDNTMPTNSVGLSVGPDGNLYFLSRTNGNGAGGIGFVYKITYTPNGSPVITQHPTNLSYAPGNQAFFGVTATGNGVLNYQWKKNGATITGANSSMYVINSVQASDAGTYTVVVTNINGTATSYGATLNVTGANTPPTATIITPSTSLTYAAGDTINFSGDGNDAEDGSLGANKFSWTVEFRHHHVVNEHVHPGPYISCPTTPTAQPCANSKTGSFTIPNTGFDVDATDVWYRLYLTVTDSQGATNTTYVDINPTLTNYTVNTNPTGLNVYLDGSSTAVTAPQTLSSVVGMQRTFSTVSPQGGLNFSDWKVGGTSIGTALSQTIFPSATSTTYTANFGGGTGGDTTPPTVSITSPLNNTSVSGTINITATASDLDNSGTSQPISKVEFYRGSTLIKIDYTAPYSISWDTTKIVNGLKNLTAKAFDSAPVVNNKTSAIVKVTIANIDTTPPVILSVSPATAITTSTSKINWTTDDYSDTQVLYGTSSNPGTTYPISSPIISTITKSHSATLSGLNPNTTYYYKVKSKNTALLTTTSPLEYSFTTLPSVTNNAPVVSAGGDTSSLVTQNIQMWGSVTDTDGPIPLTIQWTKISGPGTVVFSAPSSPTSNTTFSLVGTYILRLTATDGLGASAYDEVMQVVNP